MQQQPHMIREAVGIFHDATNFYDAIEELESSSFDRSLISVMGSDKKLKKVFGKKHLTMKILEDNAKTPRSNPITPEEVGWAQGLIVAICLVIGVASSILLSGGILVSSLAIVEILFGALCGLGIGAVLAKQIKDRFLGKMETHLNNGGLCLWVFTANKHKEKRACTVLKKYGAKDVHVHSIAVQ